MEAGGEALQRLVEDDPEEVGGLGGAADPVEGPGDAGESVVEAERAAGGRVLGVPQEPVLGRSARWGARLVEGVEHAGRAVREGLAAGGRGELGDVAGETAVLALGCAGGGDGPDHRVTAARPVAEVGYGSGGGSANRSRRPGGGLPRVAPRVAQDLLDRRPQRLLRDRESAGDVPCEPGGLRTVDAEQRGERQIQGEPQTGERIAVDVGAAPVGRGDEGRVGDDLTAALGGRGGGLEVEQDDPPGLLVDHDVAHVQIADDDAPGVHRLDGAFDLPVQLLGPGRVFGEQFGRRVLPGEREAAGEGGVEGGAGDVLEDQEVMVADLEHVPDGRYAVQPGQLLQRGPLPLKTGHGVRPVGGQTGVRAGLLEDDLLAGTGVAAEVDPAAVGEVQRLLHGVREVREAHGGAGLQVRHQEAGRGHPGGDAEGRAPVVGDEPALRIGDGGHGPPVRTGAEAGGERPVPGVHGTVPAAQVAQDVGAVLSVEQHRQGGAHLGERLVGRRVDGDELATARPVGVLGVPQGQQPGLRQALEGQPVFQAVGDDPVEHGGRIVEGGRDMDLPALRRQAQPVGAVREPVAAPGAGPPLGYGATDGRVERALLVDGPVRSGGTVRCVVEAAVRLAVRGVLRIHARSPRSVRSRRERNCHNDEGCP